MEIRRMMKAKRRIQISQPSTGNEEWQAVREPLSTGWLTQGPKVSAFQKAFAARHCVRHALATSSCTTALHLALAATGVGPGHEVIVPAFTWVATANVVLYCGATPIFADVDPITYNLDVKDALTRVTPRTKAVIPVHLFGLCADIDLLRKHLPASVVIIEDAACAAGAQYRGRFAGGLGNAGCFSFHPRKTITTGEGGMLTTNDDTLAEQVKILRSHGASVPEEQRNQAPQPYILPEFNMLGYNYRMTDLQGAIGLVQLGKLDAFIEERARWAAWYHEQLRDLKWLRLPEEPMDGCHAWQAYVVRSDPKSAPLARNDIMRRLHDRGIDTRPGTHAVPMLGYYRERFDLHADDYPVARDCESQTIALPLHNRMNKDDYGHVVKCLREIAA